MMIGIGIGTNFPHSGPTKAAPLDFLANTRLGNWSCTHRLFSDFTGDMVKMRSGAAGNPTQDIGYTAAGILNTDAVDAFKGANNAFWHTVYDQGTIGVDFSQTSISAQPAYSTAQFGGLPSMLFDGTNDGMVSTAVLPAASTWWGYAVVRRLALGVAPELWAVSSFPDSIVAYRLIEAEFGVQTLWFNSGGGTGASIAWPNNADYAFVFTGSASAGTLESSAGGSGSVAFSMSIPGGNISTVGFRRDASAYLNAHLVEWGYFSGTLSAENKALFYANLNSRFGTAIP
jgi:hypothetical protein